MQRVAERMTEEEARRVADESRRAVQANPTDAESYRRLGAALRVLGEDAGASEAEMDAIFASEHDPLIQRAASALMRNDLPAAEATLRHILHSRPNDVAAIRMLGDVALQVARPADAERLFRQALALAPAFDFARRSLVSALHAQNKSGEALEELDRISGEKGDDLLAMKAAICSRIGRFDEAATLYRDLAERDPEKVELWISLANVLKFAGDEKGAVRAYRRVLDIQPDNGEAWWSLADVKTLRFSDDDIAAMETVLKRAASNDDGWRRGAGGPRHDRLQLHFALGKAYEDARKDDQAFAHYAKGNAIRARQYLYDPKALTDLVEKIEATVTAPLLEARADMGCSSREPIFILGMPRAGSTLVEQMLASHPQIEGTAELPDIILIARELEEAVGTFSEQPWVRYPGILADLSADELQRLGHVYLERTKVQRKTDRPFFTDKMPNNWLHVGLIRLILPRARIIDIRRHPLACGFSNFKQHYARGQEFSYDLDHFGQYYRDYVRLMRHFDKVCPGSVHRVIYEKLVEDPRGELTKLMDYLEVPFDEAQLRFYETKRDVRTASAEQVRRPINSKGVDQWRRFEPWLGPLKRALGPVLKDWQR
jgi:tetratricopeptide (TPR) repeat protein